MRRLACAVGLVAAVACNEIVARPLSEAPRNTCSEHPCADYDAGTPAAECRSNRCERPLVGNLPDYPIWVVVNLPDTLFFAPGLSYVFVADANGEPAFRRPQQPNPLCTPPQCLQIGDQAFQYGQYIATAAATGRIRQTLDAATRAPIDAVAGAQAIPVRVMFTPTGNVESAFAEQSLPLQPLVTTSGTNRDSRVKIPNGFGRPLLAGSYTRELYPLPPFDAIYPPVTSEIRFATEGASGDLQLAVSSDPDSLTMPRQLLDFDSNQCAVSGTRDTRCAIVKREEGLDGWQVWLENATTGKRVSVLHTFSNTIVNGQVEVLREAATLLYTATGGGLEGLNAVVAPPPGSLGVPRLRDPLIGGAGLTNLTVPTLPPPVTVRGVVAEPGGPVLLGYRARVSLVSTVLRTSSSTNPNLEYRTTLDTDDRGQFATVVPPGEYEATVEPATGTRFAKARVTVVVDRDPTALTLRPPPRTNLRGRALLADERPAAEAAVVLEPRPSTDASGQVLLGRPARTQVAADGSYAVDLDPGAYVLSVIPKDGTGFPRVVKRIAIGAEALTAPDVRIPPPIHMAFDLRDPNATGNPILRAVVRVFASFPEEVVPVEIGNALTDTNGRVEILLAPRPE